MTTDDLFQAKAAIKAANAPPDGLLPNPKGRLKEQFHEVRGSSICRCGRSRQIGNGWMIAVSADLNGARVVPTRSGNA
jgi:hypothetical protein